MPSPGYVAPIAQWQESSGVALPFAALYWAYDVPTSTWTLAADKRLSAGELVDLGNTGVFTLQLFGVAASTDTRRRVTEVGTVAIYIY